MNIEEIEKFLDKKENVAGKYIKIDFKKRDAIYGLFIKGKDFDDLKTKNFWRIVPQMNFDQWNQSQNANLAKIFSGFQFSKLTSYKESFDKHITKLQEARNAVEAV